MQLNLNFSFLPKFFFSLQTKFRGATTLCAQFSDVKQQLSNIPSIKDMNTSTSATQTLDQLVVVKCIQNSKNDAFKICITTSG